MAIVQVIDYGPGQGKTYIDDDCVVKTPEEVQKILDTVWEIYIRAQYQKILKQINGKDDNNDQNPKEKNPRPVALCAVDPDQCSEA